MGKKKKKIGRPSKFKEEFLEQAEEMAMLGLPDKDIALILGVKPLEITRWKVSHPAFDSAIVRGRAIGHKSMTKAMFDCGCGYEREEDIVSVDKKTGKIYRETVTKYYPPNPICQHYYLGNRHKESWASIQKIEASVENIPAISFVPAAAVKQKNDVKP